jgi:hypothetical protein
VAVGDGAGRVVDHGEADGDAGEERVEGVALLVEVDADHDPGVTRGAGLVGSVDMMAWRCDGLDEARRVGL